MAVTRPPEEAKGYPAFPAVGVSQPARAPAVLPSSTVLVPATVRRFRMMPAVSRPALLAVRAEIAAQPTILAPVLRGPTIAPNYQRRLNAVPVVTVARTPKPGRSGAVSINRFVFRRDASRTVPEPATALRVDAPSGPDDLR